MIAESPPASNGFFYFPKTIGKDHLFRETMKALGLWPEDKRMEKNVDKRLMLQQFQAMGIYLIDASSYPVNRFSRARRRKAVLNQLPRLLNEVMSVDPNSIIIVKASIFHPVNNALTESGFGPRILNGGPLAFPSHGNQQKYRSMMKKMPGKAHLL